MADNINNFYSLTPSGDKFSGWSTTGLFFNGDNDFKKADIGINRNDYYMTLFQAIFTPQETGIINSGVIGKMTMRLFG